MLCEEYMTYMSVIERDDLIEGDIGEMGDYSVVELLVEQAEAHGRTGTRTKGQLQHIALVSIRDLLRRNL